MNYAHCMIDIETISTQPDATIISIGAVHFNPDCSELGPTHYQKVNWDQNRHISPATVHWWMQQSDEARTEFITQTNEANLHEALSSLQQFVKRGQQVWGNGCMFDMGILENAYAQMELRVPWDFRNIRDVRTICELSNQERPALPEGQSHNALNDAIYQAKYVSAMWQELRA